MTAPPLQQGDFVWCACTEREAPLSPGGLYVMVTLAVTAVAGSCGVMVADTTSQPQAGALPPGVIAFVRADAAALGQARAEDTARSDQHHRSSWRSGGLRTSAAAARFGVHPFSPSITTRLKPKTR